MTNIPEKNPGGLNFENPSDELSKSEDTQEALLLTPAEEKKILRRIDLWIVPYASLWVNL